MSQEEKHEAACCSKKKHHGSNNNLCGGVYFFAFIGAAVYFIQHSSGFWLGVLAVLKALVWPAILIHKIFTMIGM
ncbi:MAG: hypothetical protein ACOYMB_01540 [Patescibacteria group bacterium]